MKVDETEALGAKLTTEYQGKTYFFCGEACKKRFDAGPEKFLAAAGSN
jgi:YHS domain-containing protein